MLHDAVDAAKTVVRGPLLVPVHGGCVGIAKAGRRIVAGGGVRVFLSMIRETVAWAESGRTVAERERTARRLVVKFVESNHSRYKGG